MSDLLKVKIGNKKFLCKWISPDERIPLEGILTYQWNFIKNDESIYTDIVSNVTCLPKVYPSSSIIGPMGYLDITGQSGINLNVEAKQNDYIEIIYHLDTLIPGNNHIRLLNLSTSRTIGDSAGLIIWRMNSPEQHSYWASYFDNWSVNYISKDYNLFNHKKLGIYLKSNTNVDIFVNDVLVYENFSLPSSTSIIDKKYCLGVTTDWFTNFSHIECERVRIFRDCTY